jgi:hypothetical protein
MVSQTYSRYQVFADQDVEYLRGINELSTSIKELFQRDAQVYALKDFEPAKQGQILLEVRASQENLKRIKPQYLEVLTNENEEGDIRTPLRVKAGCDIHKNKTNGKRNKLVEVI